MKSVLTLAVALTTLVAVPAFGNSIERKTVKVEAANDESTSTGVMVKNGDFILISASGEIATAAELGKTDPNGHSGRCGADADRDGALLYKVAGGGWAKAGKHMLVMGSADLEGELKLKVHDTKYVSNKGVYSVDILHLTSSMSDEEAAKLKLEKKSLTVGLGNDEWTESTLSVQKGDVIVVFAGATPGAEAQDLDPGSPGTPDGIRCVDGQPFKSDNDAALMMKIGAAEYRRTGAMTFVVADATGPVKFRVRLKTHAGSKGAYSVGVLKIPSAAAPMDLAANERE